MGKKAALLLTHILFGLATCILAALTIAAWFAGIVSPEYSWLIALLALGLTPMLILNFIVFIIWAIKRSLWALVPLAAMLINITYITSIFQIYYPGSDQQATESQLKVASFNIHGQIHDNFDATLTQIMTLLNDEHVDIICFQEFCDNTTWRDSDSLFRNWPYHTIHSKNRGMQLAIFSKYPILDTEYTAFQKTANGAAWVDIEFHNRTLRVFNLHFQTTNINQSQDEITKLKNLGIEDPDGQQAFDILMARIAENATHRSRQVKYIREKIESALKSKEVIVCGDFNDTPSSYAYHQICNGLTDSFKAAGRGYGYTFQPIYKLFRIDYVLYSPGFNAVRYDSPQQEWSDHNPVLVELEIIQNNT